MNSVSKALILALGLLALAPLLLLGGRTSAVQAQTAGEITIEKVCEGDVEGPFVIDVDVQFSPPFSNGLFTPNTLWDHSVGIACEQTITLVFADFDAIFEFIPFIDFVAGEFANNDRTTTIVLEELTSPEGVTTTFSGACAGGSINLTENLVIWETIGLHCVITNSDVDDVTPPPTDGVGGDIDILNVLVAKIQNQVTTDIDASATAVNVNDIVNSSESISNATNNNVSVNTNTSENLLANANESNQSQDNQQAQNQVNENDQRTNVDASPDVRTGGATGTGGSAGAQSGPASASGTGTGTGTATQTGAGTQAAGLGTAPKISPPSTGSAGLAGGKSGATVHLAGAAILTALGLGIVGLTRLRD